MKGKRIFLPLLWVSLLILTFWSCSTDVKIDELKKSFTVSFYANGHGTAPEKLSLELGSKIEEPGVLSVDGYTFGGWYKEAECENKWDFAKDNVMSDITLYAKWTANTYTIKLDPNGGTAGTTTSISATYDQDVTLPVKDNCPIKEGFLFQGWAKTSDAEVIETGWTAGAKLTKPNLATSGEITVYAVWKSESVAKEFTLTFDKDYDGVADKITTLTVKEGTAITKPSPDPERTGYTFGGWYTDHNGEGTVLSETMPSSDYTLYAKWTAWNTVEDVTFSIKGEVDYNDEITLSCGTPDATIHYTIGSGAEQTADNSATIKITDNVTVKAYATKEGMNKSSETSASYTVKTYTVKFENGGHGTAPENKTLKKGDVVKQPADLTADGWTFNGWYNNEVQVTGDITVLGNITLTAKWTEWKPITPLLTIVEINKEFNQNFGIKTIKADVSNLEEIKTEGGSISYQWVKSSTLDGIFTNITDATENEYIIQRGYVGFFRCQVTNTLKGKSVTQTTDVFEVVGQDSNDSGSGNGGTDIGGGTGSNDSLVRELTDKIIVNAPGVRKPSVTLSIDSGKLAGTEIILSRAVDGQLSVKFYCADDATYYTAVDIQDSLRTSLERTGEMNVRVDVTQGAAPGSGDGDHRPRPGLDEEYW